jgi:hypothetical protein
VGRPCVEEAATGGANMATTYTFTNVINPGDPTFDQLPGP